MKKEGIMRINNYSKFFAEVAKIMSTSVKAVKQLEGRYKIELANHVHLNVYRGVTGGLFIHDHRGIANITSCYHFEDFKTIKDLYERLVSDYSESVKKEESEKHYADYTSEDFIKAGIAKECTTCPDFCEEDCIENAEWHHVSLATLANIDFDMLDEKRKVYLSFYKKWQEVRKNLRKCSCGYSYDRCRNVFRRSLTIALDKKKISKELVEYFDRQISMVNVECGVWSSAVEVATGYHKSRKYNKPTLRY